MARDRPSPYGNARRFFPVARGPVPRDLHRQEERFRSYGPEENKRRFFRGGNDGEGQALALRGEEESPTHEKPIILLILEILEILL